MSKAYKGFDIDLAHGQDGEALVLDAIKEMCKLEVKADRKWKETGNLFIETGCFENKHDQWRASGLNATISDYWFEVLENNAGQKMIIGMPIDVVKDTIMEFGTPIQQTWSENPSKGFLIKVRHILDVFWRQKLDSQT